MICLSSRVRGAFLSPKEMEDLAKIWEPYRSIGRQPRSLVICRMNDNPSSGCYYMWALAEDKPDKPEKPPKTPKSTKKAKRGKGEGQSQNEEATQQDEPTQEEEPAKEEETERSEPGKEA